MSEPEAHSVVQCCVYVFINPKKDFLTEAVWLVYLMRHYKQAANRCSVSIISIKMVKLAHIVNLMTGYRHNAVHKTFHVSTCVLHNILY